jgi:predicted O-methyltransferase YrrM
MTPFDTLLTELEAFGENNDAARATRAERMLNITRDTGEFLAVMIKAMHARRVLEVGTSNGYSTLWLAWAASAIDGQVTTLEVSEAKIALARENFARAGLDDRITLQSGDAGATLAGLPEAASIWYSWIRSGWITRTGGET